ncbi:MAG: hypothetical protein QOC89_4929 [Paraburkholderia sp.]|uniref:hypothetical protein n=1 Tax=Paraburkholderia sp. TaxID=1926495 RepID=UPI002AFF3803|nr:hypothetical protein [Paraburkholderia sp.]MEA3087232.1 hypothetical protein [Paraburkholderia sp.]
MQVIKLSVDRLNVGVSRDELLIINSALNEVCNGIDLFEFEARMGAEREKVVKLLGEVGAAIDRMISE